MFPLLRIAKEADLPTCADMSKCLSKTRPRSHTADSNLIVLAPIFMEEMGSVLRNFAEKWITLVLTVLEYQPIMWFIQSSVFTDGCISIAESHCELNLTAIVSEEHTVGWRP